MFEKFNVHGFPCKITIFLNNSANCVSSRGEGRKSARAVCRMQKATKQGRSSLMTAQSWRQGTDFIGNWRQGTALVGNCPLFLHTALCEKPLKKWNLEFASLSGDYSTFLCLLLSFLIVFPLILQNTFWSYKILVSFSTIFSWDCLSRRASD